MIKSSDVLELIRTTLLALVKARREKGYFFDEFYPEQDRALVITCEGLECFFIPCRSIPGMKPEEFLSIDEVRKDIEFIIETLEAEGFTEEPYIDVENVDSAAFVLSTLFHSRLLIGPTLRAKPAEGGSLWIRVENWIDSAIRFLNEEFTPELGWDPSRRQFYFTWSVIETLKGLEEDLGADEEFLAGEAGPEREKLLESLKGKMLELRRFIETEYLPSMASGEFFEEAPLDIYGQTQALIILGLLASPKDREIANALTHVVEVFRSERASLEEFGADYDVKHKTDTIPDYTIVPQLIRCIALMISRGLPDEPAAKEVFERENENLETFLSELLREEGPLDGPLHNLRIPSEPYKDLWGSGRFEIYFTERVIEALTAVWDTMAGGKLQPPTLGERLLGRLSGLLSPLVLGLTAGLTLFFGLLTLGSIPPTWTILVFVLMLLSLFGTAIVRRAL